MSSAALLLLLPLLLLVLPTPTSAQPSTSGFTCSPNTTAYPCHTYAFYRAGLAPNLTDLASIGDFFDVSRLMIAVPSNISDSLVSSPLVTGQPLFIPLSCSCNPINSSYAISYSNTNRTIQSGDTFYGLSIGAFGNLTTYQSVEVVNPTLVPTNLSIGVETIFPIFCKCPNSTQLRNGIDLLVSYVFQPSDNLTDVATRFGAQEQGITGINGANIQPYDTIFIPVSKLPSLTQPTTAAPVPTIKEERKGLVIGLSVGVGMLGVLLIFLVAVLFTFRGKWRGKEGLTDVERKKMYGEVVGKARSSEMEVNLMADVSDCLDKYRVFGINELKEATGGFGASSLIQGSVYKGSIDGEVYAIKKMKWNAYEELKILQKVKTKNVNINSLSLLMNLVPDGKSILVIEYCFVGVFLLILLDIITIWQCCLVEYTMNWNPFALALLCFD